MSDENTLTPAKLQAMIRKWSDLIQDDVIAYHSHIGETGLQMVDDKGTITVIGPAALHALKQNAKTLPVSQNPLLTGSLGFGFGGVPVVYLEDDSDLARKTLARIIASLKAAGQVTEIFENLKKKPPRSSWWINTNIA